MPFQIFDIIAVILINTLSFFLIVTVLANLHKEKINLWFVLMVTTIVGWVNFAYLGYIEQDILLATFFYKLNIAFVSIFFIAEYMLYIESFLNINNKFLRWIVVSISIYFCILALFTDLITGKVIPMHWGNESLVGPVNDYFNIFAFALNVFIILILLKKYQKAITVEKKQMLYFLLGTFLVIFFNIVFNIIIATILKSIQYQHFGDYSTFFLLFFTSLAIIKRKFLNIKTIFPTVLITFISVLLLIEIFVLSSNHFEKAVMALILIFFTIVSVILIRSILKEIEQKIDLQESRKKYKDLTLEQKDIIDVIGHEIKTPLTSIIQEINLHKEITIPRRKEILHSNPKDSEILELIFDSLNTIDKASNQASSLINNMIETTKIEKGKFTLNISEFDLIEIVNDSIALIKKSKDSDNFRIHFKTDYQNLIVRADKIRIIECIDALLSNAIKYGKNLIGKQSIVEIKVTTNKDYVYVAIKDNGHGIKAEDISKLGKKFIRLEPKTANLSRPGGSGLGLFVVKNIMKFHKGKLIIESEGIDKGSIFTLKFPISKPIKYI